MQVVLNDFQYDASCTLTRYFQRLLPGFMMGLLLNCLPSTNCLSWNVKLSTETVHSNKSSKSKSTYIWYNCLSPQCRPPLQRIHKKREKKELDVSKIYFKMRNWRRSSLTLEQPPVKNHLHLKLCQCAYISFTTGVFFFRFFTAHSFPVLNVVCYLSFHHWTGQLEVGARRAPRLLVFYNIFPEPLGQYPCSQDRALAIPIWDPWAAWGAVSKNIEEEKLNRFNLLNLKKI